MTAQDRSIESLPKEQSDRMPEGLLVARYRAVRGLTDTLASPLSAEDCAVQSMPEASPVKWHLAHTSWFFETFVLQIYRPGYRLFDDGYGYLFNSYYDAVGQRISRSQRALISRPSLAEVNRYRRHVDEHVGELLGCLAGTEPRDLGEIVELGLNHEQQHQELILTDIKHALAGNPLRPAYRARAEAPSGLITPPVAWVEFPEELRWIGHGGGGFAYDNEGPRHRVFVAGFRLASRPVTNGEYRSFIADGGYDRPQFWLSDGWSARVAHGWSAPLYWEQRDGWQWNMTLGGPRVLDDTEPVCHVSFYEADAFARWAGARLPTEAEWEIAAADHRVEGHFLDGSESRLQPLPARGDADLEQLFGDVWEWTVSPYTPYPGFRPAAGAVGEYNGKFMCNQIVLRGGSCATPRGHIRPTYRNFFPPEARWQFTGFRLAADR